MAIGFLGHSKRVTNLCCETTGGIKLYKSENGVVLSEGRNGVIAKEFFERIVKYPSMETINFI